MVVKKKNSDGIHVKNENERFFELARCKLARYRCINTFVSNKFRVLTYLDETPPT